MVSFFFGPSLPWQFTCALARHHRPARPVPLATGRQPGEEKAAAGGTAGGDPSFDPREPEAAGEVIGFGGSLVR